MTSKLEIGELYKFLCVRPNPTIGGRLFRSRTTRESYDVVRHLMSDSSSPDSIRLHTTGALQCIRVVP